MRKLAIGAIAAAALAGCGGGDDGATATGLFNGTSTSSRTVSTAVLGDNSYYQLYSPANNPAGVGGLVVGSGTFDGGRFVSSDARDYNMEGAGVKPASLSADVSTRKSFNGNLSSGATTTMV
ncbi:MAG: hypothetical protein JWP22_2190, partial [Ramlibacter sp.]|nr:hypothetical protein [Ramlibacter sp.]